jgi:hypothetical protein
MFFSLTLSGRPVTQQAYLIRWMPLAYAWELQILYRGGRSIEAKRQRNIDAFDSWIRLYIGPTWLAVSLYAGTETVRTSNLYQIAHSD